MSRQVNEWGILMDKIASFTVDHDALEAGIYISRTDQIGDREIITYDIRMTAPNDDIPLEMNGVHTMEHTGATFLRNHEKYGEDVIYFGPMGCRTGYYLILKDTLKGKEVYDLIVETFEYLAEYDGDVPGATPKDCGNFSDHSQYWAQYHSRDFLKKLENITDYSFEYTSFNED